MAAITSAIVGGIGALGSAYSSYRGARSQERAQSAAQQQLAQATLRRFGFGGNSAGPSGSYDPATGRINTSLGSRLEGQRGQVDDFANYFANQLGGNQLADAFGTLGAQRQVAFNQPQTNPGLFDSLQGQTQGALGLAGAQMGGAAMDAVNLRGIGNQAFGMVGGQLGQLNSFDQQGVLDLMRQQAAPFEDRAFTGMLDNQFATGRLGSTGGALQTEAFARGLGQADTARQLQSFQESRNFQNQVMGNASNLFGLGGAQRGLSDSLLNSAFGNFGNLAGLSADIEQSRFGQASGAQTNFFNQLGQLAQNQTGLAQSQQGFDQAGFGNFLRALTAGQGISNIPMDQLSQQLGFEQARSNAALGSGSSMLGVQRGQTQDALAAAFGGLSGLANQFSGWGGGVNNAFSSQPIGGGGYQPTQFGGSGAVINPGTDIWRGNNPFAGMFGGGG